MELFVYKGEWGLPSIDFDCIRVLSYVKFSGVELTINFQGNPFRSPNGMFPYLVAEDKKIAGYTKITEYLSSKGFNVNSSSANNQNYILVNGYIQYVFENLYPFFQYQQWGDPKNVDTTRTLFAKRTPFPFNFVCPRKYILKTNELTVSLANFSLEDTIEKHDLAEMTLNSKKCINWISEKIGEKKWFFGDEPSEIDFALYGYLSVMLYMTLPNNVLQIHLKQCTNLVNYVQRITKQHFAAEGFITPSLKSSSSSSPETEETPMYTGKEDEKPGVARRRYILSGVCAFIAMTSFAVMSGILSISPNNGGFNTFIQYDDDMDDDD